MITIMKQPTSIYIDTRMILKARRLKLNVSRLAEEAIAQPISEPIIKGKVCILIDKALHEQARSSGINLSKAVETAIAALPEEEQDS